MVRHGRRLFWITGTSMVLVVLVTLPQLPPVVASHFDAAGNPNSWSSRPVYALVLITVGLVLPLAIVGLVSLLTRNGPARLNIPAREHWTRPEHRHEAVRRVRSYLWWLGCVMAGIALAIHALVVAAHAHQPPRLSSAGMIVLLGVAVAAIGLWAAGWYRLLRPPTTP
jgi:uncharacterized membrane protein